MIRNTEGGETPIEAASRDEGTYYAVRSGSNAEPGWQARFIERRPAPTSLTLDSCLAENTAVRMDVERRCANLRRSLLATGAGALALIVLGGLSLDGVVPAWLCGAVCLTAGCALALTAHSLSDRLADVEELVDSATCSSPTTGTIPRMPAAP